MKTLLLGVVLAAGIAYAAETGRVFKVHSLGFTDGPTALEMAKSVVSPGGNVALDPANNRLLVFATPAEHEQLGALADQLSAPPPVVRIEVRHVGSGRETESTTAIETDGGVVIGEGGVSGSVRIRPILTRRTTETQDNTAQILTVSSGRSAMLRVGEDVPYVEWLMSRAYGWGITQAGIAWQKVGAYLSVEPTVIGTGPQALIRVRLTPELSGLVDGNPYRVRYSQVATEVVVAPGQTLQIGGLNQDREFYSRFLIGQSRTGVRRSMTIELTPTLVRLARPE